MAVQQHTKYKRGNEWKRSGSLATQPLRALYRTETADALTRLRSLVHG
jgi:hypothetical protein